MTAARRPFVAVAVEQLSFGVCPHDLRIPVAALAAGLGYHAIATTLCPGGKERMRRLRMTIAGGRGDLHELVTHRFRMDDIEKAYDLFANRRDGVLKVATTLKGTGRVPRLASFGRGSHLRSARCHRAGSAYQGGCDARASR